MYCMANERWRGLTLPVKVWRYEPFEKQVCTPYHTLAGWLIGQSVCFSCGKKPKQKQKERIEDWRL